MALTSAYTYYVIKIGKYKIHLNFLSEYERLIAVF